VGKPMESWGAPRVLGQSSHGAAAGTVAEAHPTQGTMTLAIVFLLCFAVYYFANWKALADVWPVR
jgi:hypothetical protein